MVAGTASLFLLFSVFMSASGDKIIPAEPGQDVTLTCRAPNNNIIAVKWNRTFLGDECVLLYWDGHFVPDNQHPFFKNRVDLQDRQMKDGDVSLILKDVTIFDSGTYECGVQMKETHSWERSFIYLSVLSPYERFVRHQIMISNVLGSHKTITAESGEDVTLTCRALNNNIAAVKWIRHEVEYENVLWSDKPYENTKHPSFKNRVDLQDRQMKDGDVSLILKNVTINDTRLYECNIPIDRGPDFESWRRNFIHLHVDPPDKKIVTAESGQNVTLTCRAPNNNIVVVKWSSADLGDEYVLVYRDDLFDPFYQHPSFKNRVDLQDRQMKDGDVSLILKDVTIFDTGTYWCRVFMAESRSLELISIIHLIVDPPDKIITAESGQDVTLTCRAPINNIIVVKWSRADLGDEYVLLYRDGQFVPANQHPSFKNRVDLQDRQMKDGDVSLILKNVTINDTGTYECLVAQNSEESMKLISRFSLRVADKTITAESGQDVTLTSQATNNKIMVVKWIRADLENECVLCDNQHPSFKNRVDLQDRQMKDGDVSLILKNVTINDTGAYECHVFMEETRSWKLINSTYLIVVPPPDQKNLTAESGQDLTLTCRAVKNIIITGVKWGRDDLGDEYVLLYQDEQFDPDDQHPSFKNRVDLQDRQMKDGDVSLILKDVMINDTGTYECCVFMAGTNSWKLINITYLIVVPPPGPSGGIIGLIVVILVLLLVGVGFLIYRNHKVSRYSNKVPTENNEALQAGLEMTYK